MYIKVQYLYFHNVPKCFRKITPIILLVAFAYLNGGGLGKEQRKTAAAGLFFGGVGDWIIGMRHDGIILGAVAFGIGHLFYLVSLVIEDIISRCNNQISCTWYFDT